MSSAATEAPQAAGRVTGLALGPLRPVRPGLRLFLFYSCAMVVTGLVCQVAQTFSSLPMLPSQLNRSAS